ncbi:hypothetical protein L6452_33142 [Arctium lappa]|uniref:Uncharacterized protein n=1 Tax=Arctium lappa TaxID=4217 RepID=A0ACB8Z6W8_ARCLA|nr:hypothetical protein L6452_33142 [Arctium lappa]
MLIACRDRFEINRLKDRLKSEFEMKDLGETRVILGMEIVRDRKSRTLRRYWEGLDGKDFVCQCSWEPRVCYGTKTHGLIYGIENNCDILGYCDSDYASDHLSKKHINVRDAFLVALHDAKVVHLKKILSKDNVDDMFSKSLPSAAFEHCSNLIQLKLYGRAEARHDQNAFCNLVSISISCLSVFGGLVRDLVSSSDLYIMVEC